MLEEFFCRAKREDNREWTAGYLIQLDRTTYMICDAEEFERTPEREKLQDPWKVIRRCCHKIDQSTICRRVTKLESGETLFEFDWIIDDAHMDASEVRYLRDNGTFIACALDRIGFCREIDSRFLNTVIVGNRFDCGEEIEE